ncbi:MAG: MBOAT family O-acyltransferase [Novosphingobium sp.]
MIEISTLLILLAFVAVPLGWLLPRDWALDGVAVWTVLVIAWLAPFSAVWLLAVAALTPLVLRLGERTRHRGAVAGVWAGLLLAAFSASRLVPMHGIVWIGAAFFTLRHLHVVAEWWMGRLAAPSVRSHLRYQLFLPVMIVGPIHRFPNFERQAARRRWDAAEFLTGIERALIGAFMAYVIARQVVGVALMIDGRLIHAGTFYRAWADSAIHWISLYFEFAGMTAIALGTSLMLGLRLEENFDQPWRAESLLDFWKRWHMTLSAWVLDYVFRPVMAITRSPLLGLIMAMLAIGLWHEFSLFYVLWSFWQALGIVLTRLALRWLPLERITGWPRMILAPLGILAWLSLARPVIEAILRMPL